MRLTTLCLVLLAAACGDDSDIADTGLVDATVDTSVRDGGADGGVDAARDAAAPGPWRLDEGHFLPAKMPPVAVHPRPDDETAAWARHRRAFPGIRYELPVAVQGGAWPFHFEIVEGPAGMSIGQQHGVANYGVVTWTPTEDDTATYDVVVVVTDQELTEVRIPWTVQVTRDGFVFVDADRGDDTAAGTHEAPLQTFDGWYRGVASDATYSQGIVYFRNGTYNLKPSGENSARLEGYTKPIIWLNYPDETPVMDASMAKVFPTGNEQNDLFFAGLRFENARQDVRNAHFIWLTAENERLTLWRNTFFNIGPGEAGDDNTSCTFRNNQSRELSYYAIVDNTYDTLGQSGNGVSAFDFYHVTYAVVEGNTIRNADAPYKFWFKVGGHHLTARNNTAVENIDNPIVNYGMGAGVAEGPTPGFMEVCWNNFRTNTGFSVEMAQSDTSGTAHDTWVYRNTSRAPMRHRLIGGDWTLWENNAVVTDDPLPLQEGAGLRAQAATNVADNISAMPADATLDVDGNLLGTWRMHQGTHGHVPE